MVETEKIKLDKSTFLKILIAQSLKKNIWLFALLWLITIFILFKDEKTAFDIYIIIISVFLPLYYIIWFWRYSHSDENKIFFLERYYKIDEENFIGYLSDGNNSVIKNEYFIKYFKFRNNYLLYISKNQFLFIPEDSFKSNDDLNWFKKNIITKIKN